MALLIVVSAITILALVLLEFSSTARTHLNAGVNLRDEAQAVSTAETALVLSRACLDPKAWGAMGGMQQKVELERLCNLLLGILIRGRVDLPIGGLSVELQGIEGVGLGTGDVEEVKLTPEDAFIGLPGLWCPSRADLNCPSRSAAIRQLRSLLCDPRVAHIFENEQEDGKRYTREEIIGNLIDWIDADDNRIHIAAENMWRAVEGTGEGENAYYAANRDDRYRVKNAPFDSIEELRLIRGINEELYDFLRDKVSVHASGKVNVNHASADVLSGLLLSHSPGFAIAEAGSCGQESDTVDLSRVIFQRFAQLMVDMRTMRLACNPQNIVGRVFPQPQMFMQFARDPLAVMEQCGFPMLAGMGAGGMMERGMILSTRYMFSPDPASALQVYTALTQGGVVDWNQLQRNVSTTADLFRMTARVRVGNMTRRIYAVLKKDGMIVRTLYYREE